MFDTREAWLTEASSIILGDIIAPHIAIRDELSLKISIGYAPNTRTTSKVLAVCMPTTYSAGAHNEIFVVPRMFEPVEILATLVHEIIHAVDDCKSGHRGTFAKVARAVGLEGKLTATHAGPELHKYLTDLANLLGELPHKEVSIKHVPQKSRNHAVTCANCGFKFQTSRTRIIQILEQNDNLIPCLCCRSGMTFDLDIL